MKSGGFFFELRRRRVWRVAGAYVLVVWMGLEIILETAPVLGLPGWLPRAAVTLAFVGFPVTVVLAWVFDITAHGLVRTPALDAAREPDGRQGDGADPGTSSPAPRRLEHVQLASVFGAGIVVALVGLGAYSFIRPAPAPVAVDAIDALAVLPFSDLSPDRDQAYFVEGVTEELINRLARVEDLQVAGRTSSFAMHGEGASLAEIATELGVDAIVEGSVRRSGDRLRVNVELVDARSGFQLWSESYDRTIEDVFVIQDEIATAIVDALRLQLAPVTSRRRAGTESVRAHDMYLLGLYRWHARTEEDLFRALEYFQAAVEVDDSYAGAHAGLALTFAVLPWYATIPAEVALDHGLDAASRALALDAQNAEAHAAIGQMAQALEWNLEAAEMAYRRALEFKPSYATAHQWYAETLMLMGRLEEARHEIERALELDPRSVAARYVQAYLATVRHEYDGARRILTAVLDENPGFALGQRALVDLCLAADCHDAALGAVDAAYDPTAAAVVRRVIEADRHQGDAAARQVAAAAIRSMADELPPSRRALLHAAIGERDAAMAAIEEANTAANGPDLLFALVHPLLDPMRQDARYRAVASALGIETPLAGRQQPLATSFAPAAPSGPPTSIAAVR